MSKLTESPLADAEGRLVRSGARVPRRRRARHRHGLPIAAFLAPFLILFALFYIAPIGYSIYQSFLKIQRTSVYAPAELVFAGFDQYILVMQSSTFWQSVGRVAILLVTQVPLAILLGLVFALLIDSPFVKGAKFFRLAFFAPYAVPGIVAAIMWGFFYAPSLSPLPDLASRLQLLDSTMVLAGVANIVVWTVAGFNMLVMYSALKSIPSELYEAAVIDGADQVRIALTIKVPLIMPSIIMTAVLSIIGTFQLFNEPQVLRSISRAIGTNYTPNMVVYSTATVPNYNLAAAFSVVLALSTSVLSFVFLRLTQKRAFA